jgi:hypothetical protein
VRGRRNGSGREVRWETPDERKARLEQPGQTHYVFVGGRGKDGAAAVADGAIAIAAVEPLTPAAITLPVALTADELAIRSRNEAALYAALQEKNEAATELFATAAVQLGELETCRFCAKEASERLERVRGEKDAFLARVPASRLRFLNGGTRRALRTVPWALFVADTMVLARPWGVFGGVPLPFVAPSEDVTNLTQLMRAAFVSFGLVFGGRLAGSKLRELVDELRRVRRGIGWLVDAVVAGSVVAGGILLAVATARMQDALLDIVGGGTSVQLPTSVLLSITGFMFGVSVAAGYFLSEPEQEEVREHQQRIAQAETHYAEAVKDENRAAAALRATVAKLHGLVRDVRLLITRVRAHADEEVWMLKASQPHVYGLEMAKPTEPGTSVEGHGKPGA